MQQNKLKLYEQQVLAFKQQFKALETQIQEASLGKEESEERTSCLSSWQALVQQVDTLQVKWDSIKENDPEQYKEQQKAHAQLIKQANQWTDNIFSLLDWMKSMQVDIKSIYKQMEIPMDLDQLPE